MTLAVGCSVWGRHCNLLRQQQQGRSGIMQNEQQQSETGAWACQSAVVPEASVHAASSTVPAYWCMHVRGVQHGGGIAYGGGIYIGGSNNRADLTSCTLSSNEAEMVHRHANQQCRQHLCMQLSVLCLLIDAYEWSAEAGEDRACCLVVQDGGAIAIFDGGRADLTSCVLSSNKAKEVCGHANHEQ